MLIDVHVHTDYPFGPFTRPDGTRHPSPDELIAMMDQAGIDMAVMMARAQPESAIDRSLPETMIEIAERYPSRLIPFCSLDPREINNDATTDFRPILQFFKEAGCKGVGEYVPNIPFDDPRNINLFEQVAELSLPLTFHVAPKLGQGYGVYDEVGLPRLEMVLRTCPNLKLFAHSQPFWAEIGTNVDEDNRQGYPSGKVTPGRVVELMRNYPNLYGDLSAGSGHNAISRDPDFGYGFLEEFQDRLLFGTDICYPGQELTIVPFFREIKEKRLIGDEAYEKITWQNADRLLGLGLQQ